MRFLRYLRSRSHRTIVQMGCGRWLLLIWSVDGGKPSSGRGRASSKHSKSCIIIAVVLAVVGRSVGRSSGRSVRLSVRLLPLPHAGRGTMVVVDRRGIVLGLRIRWLIGRHQSTVRRARAPPLPDFHAAFSEPYRDGGGWKGSRGLSGKRKQIIKRKASRKKPPALRRGGTEKSPAEGKLMALVVKNNIIRRSIHIFIQIM